MPTKKTATDGESVAQLAQELAAAQDAAKKAATALATAEKANYTEANARRAKAEVAWLDAYDYAADQQTMRNTAAALSQAMRNSDLGKALVNYARASVQANRRWRRATDLAALKGQEGPAPFRFATVEGNDLSHLDLEQYLVGVLARFAFLIATEDADEEAAEIDASFQAAYDSAMPGNPVAWRVQRAEGGTFRTEVGPHEVTFLDGVAYVNETVRSFFENRSGFEISPVFEVPESHSTQAARINGSVPDPHAVTVRPATAEDAYRSYRR